MIVGGALPEEDTGVYPTGRVRNIITPYGGIFIIDINKTARLMTEYIPAFPHMFIIHIPYGDSLYLAALHEAVGDFVGTAMEVFDLRLTCQGCSQQENGDQQEA